MSDRWGPTLLVAICRSRSRLASQGLRQVGALGPAGQVAQLDISAQQPLAHQPDPGQQQVQEAPAAGIHQGAVRRQGFVPDPGGGAASGLEGGVPLLERPAVPLPGGKEAWFHVEHTPVQELPAPGRRAAHELVAGRVQDLDGQRPGQVGPGPGGAVHPDGQAVGPGDLQPDPGRHPQRPAGQTGWPGRPRSGWRPRPGRPGRRCPGPGSRGPPGCWSCPRR